MNYKNMNFNIMSNKLICKIFGHKWKYNFPSLPNKAICSRCKIKAELNLRTLEWYNVNSFEGVKRSDEELCKKWVS